MGKIKKRQAFSLVAILFAMVFAMAAILAATPVLTSRMTKITTGVADNTSVNLGESRGHYVCYRQGGALKSVRVEIQANGSIDRTETNGCRFEIPQRARNFDVTVIGGGGGGAGSTVLAPGTNEVHQTSLAFETTQTNFYNVLSSHRSWVSNESSVQNQAQHIMSCIRGYLAANPLYLTVSGASGIAAGGVSAETGGTCRVNLTDILSANTRHISYSSGTVSGDVKGYIKVYPWGADEATPGPISKNIVAHEGADAYYYGSGYLTPSQCKGNSLCFAEYTKLENEYQYDCDDLLTTERKKEGTTGGRSIYTQTTRAAGASPVFSRTTPVTIKVLNSKITAYYATEAAGAGNVVRDRVPFLAPNGVTVLNLEDPTIATIGTGGVGGGTPTRGTCSGTTLANCAGANGTQSQLIIKAGATSTEVVRLTATGGVGAIVSEISSVAEKSGKIETVAEKGANGAVAGAQIPSELINDDLKGVISEGGVCGLGDANCNANTVNAFRGAGGGSAGVVYRVTSGGNAYMQLDTYNCSKPTPMLDRVVGTGATGASGAIIISW